VPYAVGSAINKASHTVTIALGVAAVIAIIAAILVVRRKTSQLEDVAEAAYPGPLPDH